MDWLIEKLRNSRVTGVIGQVERGEPVDADRLVLLQTLDIVQAGQLFLADALEQEKLADDQATTAAKGL